MNILQYITELYVCIDDFFILAEKNNLLIDLPKWNHNNKGRKKQLEVSEVVTLNIIRFLMHIKDLKAFHKNAVFCLKKYFPDIPNYENFLKATNDSLVYVILLIYWLLAYNRNKSEGDKAIDSTKLPVCNNTRINSHKVCKGIAQKSKTSQGWFFGFKLHGICDMKGNLLNISITPGNVDDRNELDNLFQNIYGLVIGDAGYLVNIEEVEKWLEKNIFLLTGVRNNMKKIMTKEQHKKLKSREIIESIWSVLKERFTIAITFARSIHGLLRHYLYAILSYFFRYFRGNSLMLEHKF